MRSVIFITLFVLLFPFKTFATYILPNNNSGCPQNCRQIPWSAGSDQWNSGKLPNYTKENVCSTAHDGITDDTATINACLNACPNREVVKLPVGTHRIDGEVILPTGKSVVLRGSGTTTVLKLYGAGIIRGYEAPSWGASGSEIAITSGYTKGSTSLTLASAAGLSVGNWISIFEDEDTAIPVTKAGTGATCTWCGMNNGQHMMQQFAEIISISGNTITVSRPLYYTYKAELNPGIMKRNFGNVKVGIEDLKVEGTDTINGSLIRFRTSLYSWVKNVETYMAGPHSNNPHIFLQFSHGCEVRDSYIHHGFSNASGSNYGVEIMSWNSDHKIENNRMAANRHSIIFEGGGSGVALLYNYLDDNWETTDSAFVTGDAGANHGPHPYMNLWEGNIASKLRADVTMGSSSHNVAFRNWFRGDRSDVFTPTSSTKGLWAVDVMERNNYYSFVGNILGTDEWTAGNVTSSTACGSDYTNVRDAFRFGCNGNPGAYVSSSPLSTSIRHGNYDYITDGVAHWDGGADHVIAKSMYYNTTPWWWCTETPWPPIGPDVTSLVNDIPAKRRHNGALCTQSNTPSKTPLYPIINIQ